MSLLALIGGLDRARFTPTLAAPEEGALTALARRRDVPVRLVPLASPSLRDPRAILRSLRALARAQRLEPFDLLHANSFLAVKQVLPFARWRAVPLVASVRDMVPFSRATGLSLAWCDRVVCVSEATREHVLITTPRRAHDRVRAIYNGVDVEALTAPLGREQARATIGLGTHAGPVFGVVAPIVRWKGQDLFLRAAATVAKADARARFVIAGDGRFADAAYLAEIDRLASDPALAGRVVRAGFVDDIPTLLAALDVVVSPAVAPDPLPRAVLEAMAAGRAVIGSRHGGIPEAVVPGETGLLVEPGSADSLAQAMLALANDATRVLAMGRAGRERAVSRFSIERHVTAMQALYDEIVAPRRSAIT